MTVLERMDAEVDDYCRRLRFYNEVPSLEVARMFVKQQRLNTRIRNSVMKLSTATNCPDWDLRLKIIGACAEEIVGDHAHAGGRPHWLIIEDLGVALGMTREEIRAEKPLPTTQLAWLCWETLTKNRHWLEGLVANTCSERANVPGYGDGLLRELGISGLRRKHYQELFGLQGDQLEFMNVHSVADLEHSNLGWHAVARYAEELKMADAVVEACRTNLLVWEMYWNGILDAGRAQEKKTVPAA